MPDLADLYPGFASRWIDTAAGRIFARTGGDPPRFDESKAPLDQATFRFEPPFELSSQRHRGWLQRNGFIPYHHDTIWYAVGSNKKDIGFSTFIRQRSRSEHETSTKRSTHKGK
jgi:hypothetical protein